MRPIVHQSLTWTNHDDETHTITSTAGAFGSTGLGNWDTFPQAFTQLGAYQ
jgi:plastocyanin